MTSPAPVIERRPAGYRFEDVEVDALRRTVSVGGREVACRPLVFQLLLLLCEAGGAVVEREQIFARLWPESEAPSDESLTQIVHRLRATLGEDGRSVRTVRGIGFRLDSPVEPVFTADPVLVPPVPPAPASRDRRVPVIAVLLGVLLLAIVAGGVVAKARRSAEVIDSGFALRRSDLGTDREETAELIRRAMAIRGAGDRRRAIALLEMAHRTDGATPIPAAILSLWEYGQKAESWAAEAGRRLPPDASAYQTLLVRYASLSTVSETADSVGALSALLELRPDAWNLRLARAHYHLARRERAAALADLQLIPIHSLGHRGQVLVLADRASLGDAGGAERDLRSAGLEGERSLTLLALGRIRRSQRRPAEALQEFQQAVEEATRRNEPDVAAEARLLAGITSFESGDTLAAARWLDEFVIEPASQYPTEACEAAGLGAYLAQRRGDPQGRDRRLAEARQRAEALDERMIETRVALALLGLWLEGKPRPDLRALAMRLPSKPELFGARSLLLARLAFAESNRREAARLLRQARLEGIDQTYFADEAALLGADLGEPPAQLWIDPPYPNLLRFAAAWELDRRESHKPDRQPDAGHLSDPGRAEL